MSFPLSVFLVIPQCRAPFCHPAMSRPFLSSRNVGVRDIRGATQKGLAIPRTETLRGDERGGGVRGDGRGETFGDDG